MCLMDRINQAKCATGMHAGDWRWMAEGACGQTRTCTRCGNVGTRDNHNVTKWAFAGDPGNPRLMERHCERCLSGETKTFDPIRGCGRRSPPRRGRAGSRGNGGTMPSF